MKTLHLFRVCGMAARRTLRRSFLLGAAGLTLAATSATAQTLNVPGGTVGNISGSNVGIGTSSPGQKLEVVGDARLGVGAGLSNDYGKSLYFSVDSSPVDVAGIRMKEHIADNYGLEFQTYNGALATRMTILGNGNVGIGTTSPATKLDVAGGHLMAEQIVYVRHIEGKGWSDQSMTGDLYLQYVNDTGNIVFGAAKVFFQGSTGNLGVGTASPTYHLQVESALDNQFQVVGKGTGYGGALLAKIYSERTVTGTDTLLQVGSAYAPNTLIVQDSGNVGIGTTAIGSYKLAVEGAIRARSVVVDNATWPDYVFKPNYHLASLSEVEGAIQRDGHLPGIPSAAEIAAGGVSLGDMQARLLAKVEELTLHLIAQEKRNDALQAEVAVLHAKLARLSTSQ